MSNTINTLTINNVLLLLKITSDFGHSKNLSLIFALKLEEEQKKIMLNDTVECHFVELISYWI